MELFKHEVNEFLRPTDNQAIFTVCLLCFVVRTFSVLQKKV